MVAPQFAARSVPVNIPMDNRVSQGEFSFEDMQWRKRYVGCADAIGFLKILIFLANRELDSEKHGGAPDRRCRESASANQEGEGILELRVNTERNWWIRGNTAGRTR